MLGKTRHDRLVPALVLFLSVLMAPARAETLNLLPALPEPARNPYKAALFEGVKQGNTTFHGDNSDQAEILSAALAYFHPDSPHKDQAGILNRLIVLVDGQIARWNSGVDAELESFTFSFETTYAYLLLRSLAPDKIPAGKRAAWEAGIRKHTAFILARFPGVYRDLSVGALVVNMDGWRIQSVYLGGLAVGDTAAARIGKTAFEKCWLRSLMADGGTHYASYSNEEPGYYWSATKEAAWYYLLTGSPAALDYLKARRNYAPLTQHPKGFMEFSTAPPWKSQYVTGTLATSALANAYLTGDGYNYAIGQNAVGREPTTLAFLYRSGLTPKALPDDFTVFDRNILGPRARYGTWGTVGTTRDPSSPLPEVPEAPVPFMQGLNTFVGAFKLNEDGSLDAALHAMSPMFKHKAGPETDFKRGNAWAFLSGTEAQNRISKSRSIYGLSAHYAMTRGGFRETTGWNGDQQWVFTPDRILGMMEMTNGSATSGYDLGQCIHLVSHRGTGLAGTGSAKAFVMLDNRTFSYGGLRIKIHATDYKGPVSNTYHDIYGNGPQDQGAAFVVLHDAQGAEMLTSYPTGTKRFALVEVTYAGKAFSNAVARIDAAPGLIGFEFQEQAGRKIRMLHNATGAAIPYSGSMACPFGKASMLKSWDEGGASALTVANGSAAIPALSIPAYGNIVVVNSDIAQDHLPGFNLYEDVFTGSAAIGVRPPERVLSGGAGLSLETLPGILRVRGAQGAELTLSDIKGRVELKAKSSEGTMDMDVSRLRRGMYVVTAKRGGRSESGTVFLNGL